MEVLLLVLQLERCESSGEGESLTLGLDPSRDSGVVEQPTHQQGEQQRLHLVAAVIQVNKEVVWACYSMVEQDRVIAAAVESKAAAVVDSAEQIGVNTAEEDTADQQQQGKYPGLAESST